jgi:hypothetical protein
MRLYAQRRTLCLVSSLAILMVMLSSCAGPPEPETNCPDFANIEQDCAEPKAPAVKEALDKCLADLSYAQDELRAVYAKGRVKRSQDMQGIWKVYIKLTEGNMVLGFSSQTSPVGQVERVMSTGSTNGLREGGYRLLFDDRQGNITTYVGYLPQNRSESVSFYPNGSLQRFQRDIDGHTFAQASWNIRGEIRAEGLSARPRQGG